MHIKEVGIATLPPINFVSFRCDERVNLLIGPNASGKSTILKAINAAYTQKLRRLFGAGDAELVFEGSVEVAHGRFFPEVPLVFIDLSDDWPRDRDHEDDDYEISVPWETIPLLYLPATRTNLPQQDIFDDYSIYRAEEHVSDFSLDDLFDTESGVFNGRYVELAIDWLRRNRVHKNNPRLIKSSAQWYEARTAIEVGYACAKTICPEVIHADDPHPYLEFVDEDEVLGTKAIVHHDMGIRTTDAEYSGEPLYAGALSSGTQGTLLWVWALALKIASHYDWEDGWESKPAILLIDEIENHLHPTWQRRVIPALLEHFPGLQIFATTHSPFVVAGLKAGQVHLLKRDENGVVTASTNTEDVIGWTADEILRTMMDVEDPTDAETAAAAHELRQLRKEGSRSAPEAEERRQERIQELRQRVDRDLLAGGPLARQREIFEQQFAEALRKYRQSKNLNQENG